MKHFKFSEKLVLAMTRGLCTNNCRVQRDCKTGIRFWNIFKFYTDGFFPIFPSELYKTMKGENYARC